MALEAYPVSEMDCPPMMRRRRGRQVWAWGCSWVQSPEVPRPGQRILEVPYSYRSQILEGAHRFRVLLRP